MLPVVGVLGVGVSSWCGATFGRSCSCQRDHDRTGGRGGWPARGRWRSRGDRRVVPVPVAVLLLPERAGGCGVRTDRRAAVQRRAGALAGRPGVGFGASARARRPLRRVQPWADRDRSAAPDAGTATAAPGRRQDRAGGRCQPVAAPGRADLPAAAVLLIGRLRSDRVMLLPAPERQPGTNGRPPRHGAVVTLAEPATWPAPQVATTTDTSRYGTVRATGWQRLQPRLTHRGPWADHDGELQIVEGTLIHLQVDRLPGDRDPKPVWLWTSHPQATASDVDRAWQAFGCRFDLEHTFRFFKQVLGWTTPKIRNPDAADRWTWLVPVAYTQLRLARDLTGNLRRPWEQPAPPGRLTPTRIRRGFRHLHAKTTCPAGAPKPGRPGPGRPPGSPNQHRAARHDVGKTTKRDRTLQTHCQARGYQG